MREYALTYLKRRGFSSKKVFIKGKKKRRRKEREVCGVKEADETRMGKIDGNSKQNSEGACLVCYNIYVHIPDLIRSFCSCMYNSVFSERIRQTMH